jgi:hypothetical protein
MNFESIINTAKGAGKAEKPEKTEKTQEELREALELKLKSLKPSLQEGIKEYEQALRDDIFEDQEGEPEGSGEARKEAFQKKLTAIFDRAEKIKKQLDSGETLTQVSSEISATYTHPDGKKETITLDFEAKLQDFISFYQKTNIDLPADFEDIAREIWEKSQTDIEQAIEQNGFDDMLIIPGDIPLADLAEKMKMENGYWLGDNFKNGGNFAGVVSPNADKSRIILFHKKTLPEVQAETGLDVHLNITARDANLMFGQNPDEHMTLPDFIIMERKVFEESGIHISDWNKKSGQWLNTMAGARLVSSNWGPDGRRLHVLASDLEDQDGDRGVRPSRCFF